jgi:hypothetical protein
MPSSRRQPLDLNRVRSKFRRLTRLGGPLALDPSDAGPPTAEYAVTQGRLIKGYMKDLLEQYHGACAAYDEGLIRGDAGFGPSFGASPALGALLPLTPPTPAHPPPNKFLHTLRIGDGDGDGRESAGRPHAGQVAQEGPVRHRRVRSMTVLSERRSRR